MGIKQIKSLVRFMKEYGVSSFKIGDLEVSFSSPETPKLVPLEIDWKTGKEDLEEVEFYSAE